MEFEHRADSTMVADMHEAGAGKLSYVIREDKVLVKFTSELPTGEVGVNVWVDAESKLREIDGSGIFLSCCREPVRMN